MSQDYDDEIDSLIEMAWDVSFPQAVVLLDEAIRIADEHHDIDYGIEARRELIEAAIQCGQPQKALVAFTWMLGQYDQDPEREMREAEELKYDYFMVVQNIAHIAEITRTQIEAIFDDLQERGCRNGDSLDFVEHIRLVASIMMGEPEEARDRLNRWLDLPFEPAKSCQTCLSDCHIFSLIFLEEYEKSLALIDRLLETPLDCDCQTPTEAHSRALFPLMNAGRWEDAAKYHQASYKNVLNSHGWVNSVAYHLQYLAVIDNLDQGMILFEKQLPVCLTTQEYWYNYFFYLAGRVLMLRMEREGRHRVQLRLPREFALFNEHGQYDVTDLSDWCYQEAEQLAERYDGRNGNSYHMNRLKTNEVLLDTLKPKM